MLVQTVSQKNWKRSFTLSLSGVEPTVASLSLDQHHSANYWATALSVMWVVRTKRGMIDQDNYKSARNCTCLREVIHEKWSRKWLTAWSLEDTFWVLRECLLCTFQTLSEHLLNTQTERVLQRCLESVGEVHLQPWFAYVNCTILLPFPYSSST